MARMPGVEFVAVSDGNSKLAMKRWDVVCVHTIVGYFPAPAAHFSTRHDGFIRQHRDTAVQSAANYQGNPRVISIENEDHGPAYGSWSGSNVPPFTAAQCEAIARICAWASQVHGVPLVLCPNSLPGSRGIAYHRQGIDGNFGSFAYGGRVAGGEVWSTSKGKVCPGDQRISQLINTIIPRARALAGGAPLEDDVSWNDNLTFTAPDGKVTTIPAGAWLMWTNHAAWQAANASAELLTEMAASRDALSDTQRILLAAISDRPTRVDLTTEQMQTLLAGMSEASKEGLRELLREGTES